jgi:hypothetical protein
MDNSTELTESERAQREIKLPAKVVVSLRAGAMLAVANVLCVIILAWAWMHVKGEAKVISVTGSARKVIQSDLIVWEGKVSVSNPDLQKGYDALKTSVDRTLAYLKQQGVPESATSVSAIWMKKNYGRDEKGNPTDKISSYELIQTVSVSSTNVQQVADVSRKITGLIKEGVVVESEPPQYLYTKLADVKITMLAEATKDATARAQQIASNSNAALGAIRDARMGVMQINPVHSNAVSDSGNNDTSSYEKEITAIVSARFELE